MSDALILGIVLPIITAISAWVTIWLNGRVAARLQRQLAETNNKVDVIETKLDENHKLTNGHMTTLLETTKELATAQEKARASTEQKKK